MLLGAVEAEVCACWGVMVRLFPRGCECSGGEVSWKTPGLGGCEPALTPQPHAWTDGWIILGKQTPAPFPQGGPTAVQLVPQSSPLAGLGGISN